MTIANALFSGSGPAKYDVTEIAIVENSSALLCLSNG